MVKPWLNYLSLNWYHLNIASWVLHQGLYHLPTYTTDYKTLPLRSTTICGRSCQVRVAEQAQKKMQKLIQEEAEVQQDENLFWIINLGTKLKKREP